MVICRLGIARMLFEQYNYAQSLYNTAFSESGGHIIVTRIKESSNRHRSLFIISGRNSDGKTLI